MKVLTHLNGLPLDLRDNSNTAGIPISSGTYTEFVTRIGIQHKKLFLRKKINTHQKKPTTGQKEALGSGKTNLSDWLELRSSFQKARIHDVSREKRKYSCGC